ncbi:DUF2341 domain-containing protein [Candidatus Microgenomates bacterium]|nr:DUF2341 domain-containing protein [Candidatus Microgenomates bacterium]
MVKRIFSVFLVASFLTAQLSPFLIRSVYAATSPWSQTDWSGGSGQTSWSDTTKFSSSSSIVSSTPSQVTLTATSGWYNASWGYRKKITIDSTKVGADLTNFPVLVSITDSDLSANARSDGYDILFTSSDGTTKLNHERESYTSGTGVLVAWVQVTSVSSSSDTDIYMYYGNSGVSDQQNKNGTWDSNYAGVWHLSEDPSGGAPQMSDSTGNNNHGTTTNLIAGDQTAGQIDGSIDFSSTGDKIDAGNGSAFNITGAMTLSAWVYLNNTNDNGRFIAKQGLIPNRSWSLNVESGSSKGAFYIASDGSTSFGVATADVFPTGRWVYYVGVYEPSTILRSYIDGNQDNSNSTSIPASQFSDNGLNATIGMRPDGCCDSDAKLDEVRVSSTNRSAGWILTEYNNQNSPSTFYAVASEEQYYPASGTLTSSIFDTGQISSWGTLTYSATTPTNTSVAVAIRTSNSSSMSGATAFSSCTAISSGSDASSNACVSDGHRYVQYQVTLSTTDPVSTPTFTSFSLTFAKNDATTPDSLDMDSPGDYEYTNNDRPLFRWTGTTDTVSGLSKYILSVDNGDSGDFIIDDIPPNRTTDYGTNKYLVQYENFSDSSSTNDHLWLHTKSSPPPAGGWGLDNNDGKLKEGKRTWTITVEDNASNSKSNTRTLFVDRTGPRIKFIQIGDTKFSGIPENNFPTNNQTPTIFGKITDPLVGDKTENKAASGPKSVEVTLETKNNQGSYDLYSLSAITLTDSYFTGDGSRITDNTANTSDKYSIFYFIPNKNLPVGNYKITMKGIDKANNTGNPTSFNLSVVASGEPSKVITTPMEEKTAVEEEIKITPIPTGDKKQQVNEEEDLTPSSEAQGPSIFEQIITFVVDKTGQTAVFFSNGIASLSFKIGEKTGGISESAGYKIVQFGYLFIKEPTTISDVSVIVLSPTSAKISWKTNHPANSKVNYGLDETYPFTLQSEKRVTDHEFTLNDLKPGTRYQFEVMSQNKNYVHDAHREFKTPPAE